MQVVPIRRRPFTSRALALTVLPLVFAALPARAEPIEFRFVGIGTGVAGTTPFTNAPFTIVALADTADIQELPTGEGHTYLSVLAPSHIDIAGIGGGRITQPTRVFANDFASSGFPTVGLSRAGDSGADLLNLADPAFAGYDLATPIGPVFESDPLAVSQFRDVASELGLLTFNDVALVTFQAVIVPEPATYALPAAAALTLRRRHRRNSATATASGTATAAHPVRR